jgi:hypothetical protein
LLSRTLVVEKNSLLNSQDTLELFKNPLKVFQFIVFIFIATISKISSSEKYLFALFKSYFCTFIINVSRLFVVIFCKKFKKLSEKTKKIKIDIKEIIDENIIKKDTFPGLIVDLIASKI